MTGAHYWPTVPSSPVARRVTEHRPKRLPVRYGSFMLTIHVPGSDLTETLKSDFAQVQRLDELAFEEAWIGEHVAAQ